MSQLGRGSTGVVVSARDRATGSVVAIKYLSDNVYRSGGFVARYRDEVTVLDRIEHPHVAQVYELVESEGSAAVVTELVTGTSLRRIIDSCGALDPESALYVLKGALLGLGEAHGRFIVHRDVKPENFIVDTDGITKVVDIGIAAPHRRRSATVGTTRYLAPELWNGQAATPASDVYAAAVVLIEAMTGKPARAANGKYLGLAGRPADDVIARLAGGTLPVNVQDVLARALDPQPGERPADADAMLDELEPAALSAYGPDWEAVGRAKLAFRMSTRRLAVADQGVSVPRPLAIEGRQQARSGTGFSRALPARLLVGAAVVVLLGTGTAVALTSAFTPVRDQPGSTPAYSHVPMPVAGPTVPTTAAPGTGTFGTRPDTVAPQVVAGLRVTGRSQTAVSLVWSPDFDNVKVAGYVVYRSGRQAGTSFDPGFTDSGLTPRTSYAYTVRAFDAAGNLSAPSPAVVVTTLQQPDTAAPTVPAGLHSTGRSVTSIALAWSAARDNVGVVGYDVVRDGRVIGSTPLTTFTDTGLAGASTHTYTVRAFDASNNASGNSAAVTVTTLTAPDTTPPSAPTGVSATATGPTTIVVSWLAAHDNVGVTGYQVFRDGVQLTVTGGTGFADSGLTPDTTYSYTVRAVDAANNVSSPSAPASALTLSPPPPPTTPPPTSTPTPTPPPPPTPTVTGLSIANTAIAAPDCTTTVEATVTVSGGDLTTTLSFTIDGVDGSVTPSLTEGTQVVVLGTVDATVDGQASVSIDGFPGTPATTWSAPTECSSPPTATADPTAPDTGSPVPTVS